MDYRYFNRQTKKKLTDTKDKIDPIGKLSHFGKKLKESKKFTKFEKFAKHSMKVIKSRTNSLKDKALDLINKTVERTVERSNSVSLRKSGRSFSESKKVGRSNSEVKKNESIPEPIIETPNEITTIEEEGPPVPPKPRNLSTVVVPNFS